jgi:RND family efflux transporter MFP subunit
MTIRSSAAAGAVVAAFCATIHVFLGGCSPKASPAPMIAKPVKTELFGVVPAGAAYGSFIGTLRAKQRSSLSFEAAGRIVEMRAEVGDQVRAGQVLAVLDQAPVTWRLDKAKAEQKAAAAVVAERQSQFQQQQLLAREGMISATALESARSADAQARSQLEAATAALNTVKRELQLTRISAPFDGEVVARLAQAHSDAAPGQPILQLQAGRALEVVAMLPDAIAATLAAGAKAQGVHDGGSVDLVLERLSARNDNGTLVQAIFRLEQTSAAVRSGGVLSVNLPYGQRQSSVAMSLPATALLPGVAAGEAKVFVLNTAGRLQQRSVRVEPGVLREGRVNIAAGLAKGERVVVAGAAFLHDGQAAVQHHATSILQASRTEDLQ